MIDTHDEFYRGSYMSVHVLMNSLTERRKKIKFEVCRALFCYFAMSLIKFNNTGPRMLDYIYRMT